MATSNVEDTKKTILAWLRDAHAMEQQSLKMFKNLSERLENYPSLIARINQHVRDTEGQEEDVAHCLERLGASPSVLKDIAAKIAGFTQAISAMPVDDEVVKAVFSTYTYEHMKIASYSILITAAKASGDSQTVALCERIQERERAMATWLGEQLPEVTAAYIARSLDSELEAKR